MLQTSSQNPKRGHAPHACRRPKILFFIDGLRSGGKERQMVELVKNLYTGGEFELAVAVMNEDIYFKEVFDLDIKIHYLVRKSKRDISVFFKLFRLCRVFRPDILHAWDMLTAVYALPAVTLLGIKFINGSIRHAACPRLFNKFWFTSKLTFAFSHRVVSNSMAGLQAHKLNISARNRFIANGFDLSRIARLESKEQIRDRFSIATPRVVGMVANFEDRKDYNSFLKAAEHIVSRSREVTFMAVGNGKNFDNCKAIVKPEHRDRIKLVGNQTNVESIINMFDICLLINNTLGHAEGTSNAILEYMALEKPVIATDSGGNKELVHHEKNGFIIKSFDVEDLTAKIQFLLDHRDRAARMGREGRQLIEDQFSLDRMFRQYRQLYREVIGDRQS